MRKKILVTGTILGCLAVILGAFGAHALKKVLTADQLVSFETGVRYQMYHALLLLFLGIAPYISVKAQKRIYILILCGIILFSGSIYFLATNDFTSFDFKTIGFITPIGGTLLIVAWVVLIINFFSIKTDKMT